MTQKRTTRRSRSTRPMHRHTNHPARGLDSMNFVKTNHGDGCAWLRGQRNGAHTHRPHPTRPSNPWGGEGALVGWPVALQKSSRRPRGGVTRGPIDGSAVVNACPRARTYRWGQQWRSPRQDHVVNADGREKVWGGVRCADRQPSPRRAPRSPRTAGA